MKIMMLILESPEDFENRNSAAGKAYWDSWSAYSAAVGEKVVGGNVLDQSSTAVTLRMEGGKRLIQDGPFASSKEGLGGYIIFDVESMDEALELASTCPALDSGAVELRPIIEME